MLSNPFKLNGWDQSDVLYDMHLTILTPANVQPIPFSQGSTDISSYDDSISSPNLAEDTFEGNFHFVKPHHVEDYYRQDGTPVDGYWRDGDRDTQNDLSIEDGGGWVQSNPSSHIQDLF